MPLRWRYCTFTFKHPLPFLENKKSYTYIPMLFQFISITFLATFAACVPAPQVADSDDPINCGTIALLGKENTVTNIVGTLNGECNVVSDGIGVLTLNGNSRCRTMFMFE